MAFAVEGHAVARFGLLPGRVGLGVVVPCVLSVSWAHVWVKPHTQVRRQTSHEPKTICTSGYLTTSPLKDTHTRAILILPLPSPGSRRPRLPLNATFLLLSPQMCPVTCCLSRHGKEPKTRTTKHGLKCHAELQSSGQPTGQVPDACLADKTLHICPVCPRLISTRKKSLTCCSRCSLTFHNSCPNAQERPLKAGLPNSTNSCALGSSSGPTFPRPPRNRGRAAPSPLSPLCCPTTTRRPGTTFHACRSWSSMPMREKPQQADFQRCPENVRAVAGGPSRVPLATTTPFEQTGEPDDDDPEPPEHPPSWISRDAGNVSRPQPGKASSPRLAPCCSTSRQPHKPNRYPRRCGTVTLSRATLTWPNASSSHRLCRARPPHLTST